MSRQLPNWLEAYVKFAGVTEAPTAMHFWTGVSVLAGAVRRKVWLDMKKFKWYPSFYIIFVARPGLVGKTTNMDIGMGLLKEVEGVHFGPDVITWPALVERFAAISETFTLDGEEIPMAAMTLASGELGNLVNPQDRDMLNLYITLWDCKDKIEKTTKFSGCDIVINPWINILGCTTTHWIADNMPAAAIGGGFTSRCIFIYADKKDKLVPYVDETVDDFDLTLRKKLIADLTDISNNLVGPLTLSKQARDWGHTWYEKLWTQEVEGMDDKMMEGYIGRKQTHLHKAAMILSISRGNSKVIELEDMVIANQLLMEAEPHMHKVFSKIGRTEDSLQSERLLDYIKAKGSVSYEEAYRNIHFAFPDFHSFEGIISGLIRAGYVKNEVSGGLYWLTYIGN